MVATVTAKRTAKRTAKTVTTVDAVNRTKRAPSAKVVAAERVSRTAAAIPFGIFAAGLALSLAHQAHGVEQSTTVAPWEAWAMAIEIDMGFLAAKALPYLASGTQRRAVEKWCKPLAIACFVLCAYFNAAGFVGFVPAGWLRAAVGITLGGFLPATMLVMSMVGRIMTLGSAR